MNFYNIPMYFSVIGFNILDAGIFNVKVLPVCKYTVPRKFDSKYLIIF